MTTTTTMMVMMMIPLHIRLIFIIQNIVIWKSVRRGNPSG